VSFFGLVLGVVALLVVVSVMNGFDRELRTRILGVVPNLVVSGTTVEEVRRSAGDKAVAVAPFKEAQVMLLSEQGSHLIALYGIEPDARAEARMSILPDAMIDGSIDNLAGDQLELILGVSVARRLGLISGDSVSVIVPRLTESGRLLKPRVFKAVLAGTFEVGSELDYRLGVMALTDMLTMTDNRTDVRVKLANIFAAPMLARQLDADGLTVTDWSDRYGDFFETVRMEKIMMFILLSFVIAVASFSIVSGLSMLVDSKRRDIAVLRTMGMSESGVLAVFLVQGISVALTGIVVGLILGIPLAHYTPAIMGSLETIFGFSIVEGTYFDQIPTDVRWPDVAVIVVVAFVISLLATLYPSIKASRLQPAAILRYE
jgi:lipoprotein-releasing system permease protein